MGEVLKSIISVHVHVCRLQSILATHGIPTQTQKQVEPIKIKAPGDLLMKVCMHSRASRALSYLIRLKLAEPPPSGVWTYWKEQETWFVWKAWQTHWCSGNKQNIQDIRPNCGFLSNGLYDWLLHFIWCEDPDSSDKGDHSTVNMHVGMLNVLTQHY